MFIANATLENIMAVIDNSKIRSDDVLLILLAENRIPDIDRLVERLNKKGVDFFGGGFPGIIDGTRHYTEGAVITVLPAMKKPFLITGLDTEEIDIPDFTEGIIENPSTKFMAMILVDGLTSGISLFLGELFNYLGNAVNYVGGGAGSLTLEQAPCLFTPEGFVQDAAIVTFIRLESNLGVRHGWEKIMGPVVATKTSKNVIKELNWENALQVYKDAVEADSGKKISADNFFEIAKGYPFGILKEGMEDIVRDPIATNDEGEIICVGEVPMNAALSILKGKAASLIHAAGQAADCCMQGEKRAVRHSLIVDCISRVIFLGEKFTSELEIVNQKINFEEAGKRPMGMLTLGEISSPGEGILEFFNKTIVVATLYDVQDIGED